MVRSKIMVVAVVAAVLIAAALCRKMSEKAKNEIRPLEDQNDLPETVLYVFSKINVTKNQQWKGCIVLKVKNCFYFPHRAICICMEDIKNRWHYAIRSPNYARLYFL